MYLLSIEPEAEDDLDEAYRWYEGQRSRLGRALWGIEEASDRISRTPELHTAKSRNVRQTLAKRFPCELNTT